MSQLELDLRRPAAPTETRAPLRQRSMHALRTVLLWTPAWVPLLFLAQLLALGLRPALAERARLDQAEGEVRARADALRAEQRELEQEARMLADDVYQERVRRSLIDPAAQPLTLQRARAASKP
jgi:cell division protein FtsB